MTPIAERFPIAAPDPARRLLGLAADIYWRADEAQVLRDVESLAIQKLEQMIEIIRHKSLRQLLDQAGRESRERALAALARGEPFREVSIPLAPFGGRGHVVLSGCVSAGAPGRALFYEGTGRFAAAGADSRHRREVAYLLEQAELGRRREERARREAEILLRSIAQLTRPVSFAEKCRQLFKAFRGALDFDTAVLLRYGVKGRFYVTAASDEGLVGACAGAHSLLQAALEEEALNVPDLADIEDAAGDLQSLIWSHRAALFSTIRIGKERALLALLHRHPGHYSDFDLRLMRRLSVVATEALQSDIQRTMAVNASKLAALGEVIAGIAHEINQPLSIIGLSAANIRNLLKGSPQAPAVERKLARIEEQVGLVAAITKSIRSFAYPQKSAERVEPVSLDELLGTVRILSVSGLRSKGIELEVEVPPGCPRVMANRIGLQQVLINLINNARDAIDDRMAAADAGFSGRIRISVVVEGGGFVRLCVRDNGGGIPPQALNQVFDSFYTLKEEGKGTGLGLPICKMLVDGFGGNIALANVEGGAEVTVQLAVAEQPEPAFSNRPAALQAHPSG